MSAFFFFFNDTATTEIYTLSLHDALPIYAPPCGACRSVDCTAALWELRSEEHTSELQSRPHLVCRLLLEKKKLAIIRQNPSSIGLKLRARSRTHEIARSSVRMENFVRRCF